MFEFLLAVSLLLITPGPGVLTVAGVGSGFGFNRGLPYTIGIIAGGTMIYLAVATGLAAVIFAVPWVKIAFQIGSVAYLVYLAARIAFSGAHIGFIAAEKVPSLWNGLALQVINPKAYAVNTALVSNFTVVAADVVADNAAKIALMNLVSIPIHLAWLTAGATIKELALTSGVTRTINYAMAAALLAVVVIALI